MDFERKHFVYLGVTDDRMKIGFTWNTSVRERQLSRLYHGFRLLGYHELENEAKARRVEKHWHSICRAADSNGEWHPLSDLIIADFISKAGGNQCAL